MQTRRHPHRWRTTTKHQLLESSSVFCELDKSGVTAPELSKISQVCPEVVKFIVDWVPVQDSK